MAFVFEHEAYGELIFDSAHGYVIKRPTGIDALTATFTEALNFSHYGTSVSYKSFPHRIVNINGIIVGPDQARKRDEMIKYLCSGAKGRLKYDSFYLDCYVQTSPNFSGRPFNEQFSFSLLAPDPRWISIEKTQIVLDNSACVIENDSDFSVPWELHIRVTGGSVVGYDVRSVVGNFNPKTCRFRFEEVAAPAEIIISVHGLTAMMSVVRNGEVVRTENNCLYYKSDFVDLPSGPQNLYVFRTSGESGGSSSSSLFYYKTRGGM